MIYFISPYISDFKRFCDENALPAMNSKHVKWIYASHHFGGACITPDDEVIYGEGFKTLGLKEQDHLMDEVQARKYYGTNKKAKIITDE